MNSNNMHESANANALAGTINASEKSSCVQLNQPLTREKQAEFDNCIELLREHTKKVPQVAKAIAIIDREGYFAYYAGGIFRNTDDFLQKIFGFDRTYIFRMKKFGAWLIEKGIPEGKEPSETSVRGMFQNGFTDEDREKIYRNAQENCFNRRKKGTKSSPASSCSDEMSESDGEGDSMSGDGQGSDSRESPATSDFEDEILQIVPEAKDIRKAIEDFKADSDRIYFPQLDNKSYPKDTSFSVILKENAEKFTTTGIVLECFKLYKTMTNMTVVDEETEQSIRELIRKLIRETEAEMNDLLQNPTSATEPSAD